MKRGFDTDDLVHDTIGKRILDRSSSYITRNVKVGIFISGFETYLCSLPKVHDFVDGPLDQRINLGDVFSRFKLMAEKRRSYLRLELLALALLESLELLVRTEDFTVVNVDLVAVWEPGVFNMVNG